MPSSVLAPCGQGPVVIHQHWGVTRVSQAAHIAPQLRFWGRAQGPGPPGVVE